MIYALDVGYHNNIARVASIGFKNWSDNRASYENISYLKDIAPYEAGAFYKRELPSLLFALNSLDDIETIIIDGYIWLEEPKIFGLGMYLYEALNRKYPIIGVAKSRFKNTPKMCELFRGESRKPLFITSIGLYLEEAKRLILNMHGKYRIPTLLKRVDSLSRFDYIE
jgi:deoxyribonuclease V